MCEVLLPTVSAEPFPCEQVNAWEAPTQIAKW
jgi:hypothetical protein